MSNDYPDTSGTASGRDLVGELFSTALGSTKSSYDYQLSLERVEDGNTALKEIPQKVFIEGPKSFEDVDILSLSKVVENLFRIAESEEFEDGMDSIFSLGLQNVIETYGNLALSMVSPYIFDSKTSVKVVSETLCQLGQINHIGTHRNRLRIIEKSLLSNSTYIRDSAGLGLSFLDDPAAIESLEEAIEREINMELKKDLEMVLEQLVETIQ